MTRLKPPTMPPHLEEKFWRSLPKGARVTPPEDLQLHNFPLTLEDVREYEHARDFPDYGELLRYWNEEPERGGDEEC